jgi:hypothetical protein
VSNRFPESKENEPTSWFASVIWMTLPAESKSLDVVLPEGSVTLWWLPNASFLAKFWSRFRTIEINRGADQFAVDEVGEAPKACSRRRRKMSASVTCQKRGMLH